MTFTAVVCSHENERGLRHALGVLRYQTRPPDETLVYVSGPCDVMRLREDFPEASVTVVDDHQDWGHSKRARGLEEATGTFVGFFNDDDKYHPEYVERMLAAADGRDAAYCSWNIPEPSFSLGSSTSGNFIVRTSVGRQAGYTSRSSEADGHFINTVAGLTSRVAYVPERLYFHNEGERG